MGMSSQTVCTGYFIARQKALVFIELEAGWALVAGVDVLEKRY
jgi:hypothetical protein